VCVCCSCARVCVCVLTNTKAALVVHLRVYAHFALQLDRLSPRVDFEHPSKIMVRVVATALPIHME